MDILSKPSATKEQLLAWVKTKNPNQLAIDLLDLYWAISVENGVNPIITYCQSMKETAYHRYGGVLDSSYFNPCGLKNSNGGGDYDANAHKRFDSWSKGILAQVEHLALYAGKSGYPLKDTVDPRHFPYLLGTAKTVESLSGKWAGATYGQSIVAMCEDVAKTIVVNPVNEEIKKLNEVIKNKDIEISNLDDEVNKITIENSVLQNKIDNIRNIID